MKKHFSLDECIVRPSKPEDETQLITLARGIWGGSDYLPKILSRWLNEPYFFVCEYHGKVISCIKLTLLPDHVLWFEGLRVHKSYQGLGVGSLMNREMFRFAAALKQKDPLLQFEFCTYYKNVESLHLTQKIGFRIMRKFITLDKHGIKRQLAPQIISDYDLNIFSLYPDYIPFGWQMLHNCPETLEYIKPRITVFRTPQSLYMLAGLAEKNIILLAVPPQDIKAELPYFQYFFKPYQRYGVIFPTKYKRYRKRFLQAGFFNWDSGNRLAENMLVLKHLA